MIVKGSALKTTTASGKEGKVKYMIKHILYPDQIKHLKNNGFW